MSSSVPCSARGGRSPRASPPRSSERPSSAASTAWSGRRSSTASRCPSPSASSACRPTRAGWRASWRRTSRSSRWAASTGWRRGAGAGMRSRAAGRGVPPGRSRARTTAALGRLRRAKHSTAGLPTRPGGTPRPATRAGALPRRSAWWWGVLALCGLAVGCGTAARLTRAEGDGGWSAARRAEEGARLAAAPAAEAAPAGPLTLTAALALAARGNRRIAEAEEQLEVARARVWETRGRLLPATTGSGRYTWYTDPQTTRVVLPPGLLPAGTTPPAVIVRQAEFGVVNGTLRLPLDLSGELQHTLAAAQAGYRGERARLWATRLAEQVRVIRAYFQLLAAERLAEETARALVSSRLPRFDAGGAIDYSSATIVQPQRVGSGFVGFTWDLGTDTRREAEIAAARHEASQNRIAVGRELDELEAAVRTAQRAAEERLAAAAAAEAGVAQAEENLRIRRQQFDAGRATSDDVLDAEALLAAQRATRAGALYQAHTRRAELQELLGLPLDDVVADTR